MRHYKLITVKIGKGVTLDFGKQDDLNSKYFSIGPNGNDVMLRGAGQVFCFDTWEQLVAALSPEKAAFFSDDKQAKEGG